MEEPQYIEFSNERAKNNSEVALVQNSTAESHVQLASMGCCESGDTNTLSCSCKSNGGDINVRSCNFSRYLESDNGGNISEEILNYLHMLINNEQQTTPESITMLKINVGKTFTVLLIYLSVFLKDKTANLIRNCGTH